MSHRDRILGSLLGGAVGDALGAGVEFDRLDKIRARFGPRGIRAYTEVYGRKGAITDDTQMTLFTAEGLIRGHVRGMLKGICHRPSVIHHAYLRWFLTQGGKPRAFVEASGWLIRDKRLWARRAPGNTCLDALGAATGFGEFARNDSKGCGTVMRVAPIGLVLEPAEAFQVGLESSQLTHGHPAGYLAGGAFSYLLALLMEKTPLRDAIWQTERFVRGLSGAEDVVRSFDALRRVLDEPGPATAEKVERLGGGWVAEEALVIAFYCALVSDSFDEALFLAVNHSGDSDSTGSLVGQLLGAAHGAGVIGRGWLEELELRDMLEKVAEDLAAVRERTFDVRSEENWERYPGF